MIFRNKCLIVIDWLLFIEWTTAYKTGCYFGYCFVASNPNYERLKQSDAQNWCQANGTKLVEIREKNIQDAISSFLNTVSSEYNSDIGIFTNGTRFSTTWSRINGSEISSLSVVDDQDSSKVYAFLQYSTLSFFIKAGRAADSNYYGYICQDEKMCTQNGGKLIGGNCYKNYEPWYNWYDARQKCLTSGGDLASLDSITDDQQLKAFNSSWLNPLVSYWIGIRRERWQWSFSNSDYKYTNWDNSHPILSPSDPHDCLCILPWSWKWKECRCTDTSPFLCFSEPSSSSSKTTPSSSISTSASTTTTTVPAGKGYATDQQSNSRDTISLQEIHSSTPASHNDSRRIDANVAIGSGVGVGAGIIVVAIVVIIVCKRYPLSDREKEKKKDPKGLKPPDIISLQTNQVSGSPEENPYGIVVNYNQSANSTSAADNNNKVSQTVYVDLKFVTTFIENNKKVATGNSKGSSTAGSHSEEKTVKSSNMDDQEYANISRT